MTERKAKATLTFYDDEPLEFRRALKSDAAFAAIYQIREMLIQRANDADEDQQQVLRPVVEEVLEIIEEEAVELDRLWS